MSVTKGVGPVTRLLMSLAAALGILLFMAGPRAQAETVEQCQHRIAHAEHELHRRIDDLEPIEIGRRHLDLIFLEGERFATYRPMAAADAWVKSIEGVIASSFN